MSVTLTEAAARHVSRYIQRRGKGVGVRLGVKTTRCSGLAYKSSITAGLIGKKLQCPLNAAYPTSAPLYRKAGIP